MLHVLIAMCESVPTWFLYYDALKSHGIMRKNTPPHFCGHKNRKVNN